MHWLFLGSSLRYSIALLKKNGRSNTAHIRERACTVSRPGVHGRGQVRGSILHSLGKVCIMGTVQRTCERETERLCETVRGNGWPRVYVVALIGRV